MILYRYLKLQRLECMSRLLDLPALTAGCAIQPVQSALFIKGDNAIYQTAVFSFKELGTLDLLRSAQSVIKTNTIVP